MSDKHILKETRCLILQNEGGRKMYCKNCGTENAEGSSYCKNCGTPLREENHRSYERNSDDYIPEDYKPISMWGYFGYEISFSIPLVGFILLLVFSFGGTKNKNLKNFARSYFCFLILLVILFVIIGGGSIGYVISSSL